IILLYKMIAKIACRLARHVSTEAHRTTQVRRFLHGAYFRIEPSIQEALVEGRPVVALESTIITHGMAYPQNLSMAREVEKIVMRNGAVPATIALDVSADLTELGRTPVAVVSAGVKSILDIGRTLEYLETQGVCVAAFGASRMFPAFFSSQSGFQAPYHVQDEEEAAKLIASTLGLGLSSGVLIAVPCPQERAASGQLIEDATQQALSEASSVSLSNFLYIGRSKGITGKELTPFLLQKINELTSGKSLDSSILLLNGANKGVVCHTDLALIQNNARVGSCIAVALSKLQKATRKGSMPRRGDTTLPQPVVIGGINVDFIAKAQNPVILSGGQTNAGRVRRTFGGVGRNLADCLSRLGLTPLLLSAVGKDEHSESVLHYCHHMDMSAILQLEGKSTATYSAVITSAGELSIGLGDMDIHQQITEQYVCMPADLQPSAYEKLCGEKKANVDRTLPKVSQFKEKLCQAPLVCIDGNVPLSTIQYVCKLAREHQLAVCYEPTDENKASKPFLSDSWKALTYISPNLQELKAINRTLGNPLPAGTEHSEELTATSLCAAHYPAIPISKEQIVNVSGAGDSLMAGIAAGMLANHDTDTCVWMGLLAARLSLCSYEPISPEISTSTVSQEQVQSRPWPKAKVWKLD
ncbi:hypothetical protein ASZ78_015750, partial [Callipepla squamata]